MIFRWARPKDAVLLFDLFPRNAEIVSVAAARSCSHLIKNCARAIKLKVLLSSHASCNLLNDPPIRSSVTWRIRGLIYFYHASFTVRCNTLIFTPCATRQNYVGVTSTFRHEKIDANVKVQPFQRTANVIRVWKTDHHVVTNGE